MTQKWQDFTHHWEDWLNMAIGAGLIGAPWLLGLPDQGPAAVNAFIVGAAIFLTTLLAVVEFMVWEEWLLGILGLWLIAAPWALGFADEPSSLWVHLMAGGLVSAAAAMELWTEHVAHVHDSGARHSA